MARVAEGDGGAVDDGALAALGADRPPACGLLRVPLGLLLLLEALVGRLRLGPLAREGAEGDELELKPVEDGEIEIGRFVVHQTLSSWRLLPPLVGSSSKVVP